MAMQPGASAARMKRSAFGTIAVPSPPSPVGSRPIRLAMSWCIVVLVPGLTGHGTDASWAEGDAASPQLLAAARQAGVLATEATRVAGDDTTACDTRCAATPPGRVRTSPLHTRTHIRREALDGAVLLALRVQVVELLHGLAEHARRCHEAARPRGDVDGRVEHERHIVLHLAKGVSRAKAQDAFERQPPD